MTRRSRRVRVGLVGYGTQMRSVLVPALLTVPFGEVYGVAAASAFEVVGVATASRRSAREAETDHHVPVHIGYADLLARDDVDAVLIAVPPDEAAAATVAALRAGKHVFCEAPGVRTPREAAAVRRAFVAAKDRVLVYGACTRYMPVYRKLRELIAAGRRTDPTRRLIAIRYFIWNWFYYDLARFLAGDVRAATASRVAGHEVALLEFRSGDAAVVTTCPTDNPSAPLEAVDVTGGRTWLSARNGWELVTYARGGGRYELSAAGGQVWHPSSLPYGRLNPLYLRGYTAELAAFLGCVRTGAASDSGLDDVVGTMRLMAAVSRSMSHGRRVVLGRAVSSRLPPRPRTADGDMSDDNGR